MRVPRVRRRLNLNKLAPLLVPKGLAEAPDRWSYKNEWYGHDGIDMREQEALELLRAWTAHADLFAALRADPLINTQALGEDQILNGWFTTPDAEMYAAMIATFRPDRIVEVGAGYSTLVARKTIEFLGLQTRVTIVDPEPRTDVEAAADDYVLACVEDVDIEELPLERPLLLFIDSSHVTRTGGDIPFLYNKVVPRLRRGSIVHVHDVFIPFDYPPRYQMRLYTEQYVLHALLEQTAHFEMLFATAFMASRHPDELARVFGHTVPEKNGGASIWFRVAD